MCSRNTVRESSHISFFCGEDPFCEVVQRQENIHVGSWQVCLSDQRVSPFCLRDQRISAFSPKLQTLYCLFKSHAEIWISSSPTYFLFMAPYRNLHTSVFFSPVICWSYRRTEISVIQFAGNKLHFSFSCETTLLMLSCDRIESGKFIVAS